MASVSCSSSFLTLSREVFFGIFYNFLKFVWNKSICFQSPSLYRGSIYSFLHLFHLIMYPGNNSIVVYSLDFSSQQQCWYTMIYSAFPLLMNIWIISSLLLLKLVLQWIVLCSLCVVFFFFFGQFCFGRFLKLGLLCQKVKCIHEFARYCQIPLQRQIVYTCNVGECY